MHECARMIVIVKPQFHNKRRGSQSSPMQSREEQRIQVIPIETGPVAGIAGQLPAAQNVPNRRSHQLACGTGTACPGKGAATLMFPKVI